MVHINSLHHLNLHKKNTKMAGLVAREHEDSDTEPKKTGAEPQKPDKEPQGSDKESSGDPAGDEKSEGDKKSESDKKSEDDSKDSTPVAPDSPSKIASVVIVTVDATFTEDVAGYTTLAPTADESPRPSQPPVVTKPEDGDRSSSKDNPPPEKSSPPPANIETTDQPQRSSSRKAVTTDVPSTLSSTSAAIVSTSSPSPGSVISSSTTLTYMAVASSSSTLISSLHSGSLSHSTTTASSTSTAAAVSSSSQGMSSGGKAGLVVGVISVIALLAGGILWFIWKKKKANDGWQKPDDEKIGFDGGLATGKHTPFFSDLATTTRLGRVHEPNGGHEERRVGANPADPFKDPHYPSGSREKVPLASPPDVRGVIPTSGDESNMEAVTGVATGTATSGAALVAGADKDGNGQPKNGLSGGAATTNVYRVQLDFRPSMDDELDLRAGQLVRVLHEYDDGWALCIRFDRSQQGVAPRTCLSASPVKLRPTNGSPRMAPKARPLSPAQSRPMLPSGSSGSRPNSPATNNRPPPSAAANSNGALSPLGQSSQPMMGERFYQSSGQFNQAPRPLPAGLPDRSPQAQPQQPKRSLSPGPYGARAGPTPMTTSSRRRSKSVNAVQVGLGSPHGSSPLARSDPMTGWVPPKPQDTANYGPGIAL